MEALFVVKKLVSGLILPPTGPLLLSIAGLTLVQINFRPRLGRALAWTGVLTLMLLAWPPVSALLTRAVAVGEALDMAKAEQAQAIVVLGGGLRRNALEYGGDTVGTLTLERVRYGAYIARRTRLPVLVTGGTVFRGSPEAEVMRKVLENEFDVPVRWAEAGSRDTHQNALNSAKLLSEDRISRVILVAHAVDMRRARREFTQAGMEVVPAPTGVAARWSVDHPLQLLPNAGAFHGSYYATYEMVANVAAWLGLLAKS